MMVSAGGEWSEAPETDLLDCRGHDLEVGRDVAPEDSGLEGLDVASDVRLRLEQVPVVHVRLRLDVPVRHDDLAAICLHLI